MFHLHANETYLQVYLLDRVCFPLRKIHRLPLAFFSFSVDAGNRQFTSCFYFCGTRRTCAISSTGSVLLCFEFYRDFGTEVTLLFMLRAYWNVVPNSRILVHCNPFQS